MRSRATSKPSSRSRARCTPPRRRHVATPPRRCTAATPPRRRHAAALPPNTAQHHQPPPNTAQHCPTPPNTAQHRARHRPTHRDRHRHRNHFFCPPHASPPHRSTPSRPPARPPLALAACRHLVRGALGAMALGAQEHSGLAPLRLLRLERGARSRARDGRQPQAVVQAARWRAARVVAACGRVGAAATCALPPRRAHA
eukprot:197383-Prymnesium_polylepis.1